MKDAKEIMAKLENGVKNVFESEEYKRYLEFMGKFHEYSVNNIILIMMQKPDASLVAGYQAWKTKFHRQVRKGEKSITILAPNPRKYTKEVVLADGTVEEKKFEWLDFRPVSVFDVSQTDGEEIPTYGCNQLDGAVKGFEELKQKLETVSPVKIVYEEITNGAKGFFKSDENKIVINTGMSESQTVKTMVHEISHSMLHGDDGDEKNADRNTKEVQAESVAYMVCDMLGLDTSDYSFGYIAGWSTGKEVKELTKSMEVIRKTASELVKKLNAVE